MSEDNVVPISAADKRILRSLGVLCDEPRDYTVPADIYKASAENWIKIAAEQHYRAEDAIQSMHRWRAAAIALALMLTSLSLSLFWK